MKLINNVLERQVDENGLLKDATQRSDCTPDDWCDYNTNQPETKPEPSKKPENINISDEEIPLTNLPEEEVPLSDVPKTGDLSVLWLALTALSGTGLAGVSLLGRKKQDEE